MKVRPSISFHLSSSFSAVSLRSLLAYLSSVSRSVSTIFCASCEERLMIFLASVMFLVWKSSTNLSVCFFVSLSSANSLSSVNVTSDMLFVI